MMGKETTQKETQQAAVLPASPEVSAALVAQRVREDVEFRKRFEKDPKAALFESAQTSVPPAEMQIVVHENTPDCWHISIPSERQIDDMNELRKMQESAGQDLTDEQLNSVSGGLEIGFSLAIGLGLAIAVGAGVGTAGAVAGGVAIANRRD